jgi:hypothetical protein
MHGNHIFASFALILGAGTLIVAGSICALSSQIQTLADYLKARGRQRRTASERATSPFT